MKNEICLDLTEIRDFFQLICYEQEASREEVYNFLQECLKYVFKINQVNIKDYKVTLHTVDKMSRDDEDAYMTQSDNKKEFDVYLNKNHAIYKGFTTKNMENLLTLIYIALHEYGHIMQYIKYPKLMVNYDAEKAVVFKNMAEFVSKQNTKDANIITREYIKHDKAKRIISCVEKDASKQAYDYFKFMLKLIMKDEEDMKLKSFLYDILTYVNQIRKDDFYNYRAYNKSNKEALSILSKYGIHEEDLITF